MRTAAPCHTCWSNLWVDGSLYAHSALLFLLHLAQGEGDWGHATDTLQVAQRTGMELLPTFQVQGKHMLWCFLVPLSWIVPSAPRELLWFPNILYVVSCLLFKSYSIGCQLSLRGKCSKYECTCHVSLGGVVLNILLCSHLGPASQF